MGLTKQQVIDDILDRYEAHLAFLTVSSESDTASVLTPSLAQAGAQPAVPPDAGEVEDLADKR